MRTNTDRYEAAHGSKPKGFGSWWFEITFTDGAGRYATETHTARGTLAEARAAVVKKVRRDCGAKIEIIEVVVMP